MKRFIPIILVIILLSAGCAFVPYDGADYNSTLESQITGKIPMNITGSTPADEGNIQDTDGDTGDVEGIIYIYFNDYLSSSVVNATNFELMENHTDGSIEDVTVEYEKNFKRVKITATFADGATYSLKISGDIVSAGGCFLDGNGNSIEDGAPYDDTYLQFSTGGAADWADHDNPKINGMGPNGGDVDVDNGFFVFFDDYVDSESVADNVSLVRESNGDEIDLELMNYFGTGALFRVDGGDSLAERQAYIFTVKCSEIVDTFGNVALPPNGYYLPEIPDFSSRFMTNSYSGDDYTPPTAWVSMPSGASFLTVHFSEPMDIATLTAANIKFYADMGNGPVYVEGDFSIRADSTAVDYSLINFNWDNFDQGLIVISKDVTDNSDKNWPLDGNGNGIGGETADIERDFFGYEDSDNYSEVIF